MTFRKGIFNFFRNLIFSRNTVNHYYIRWFSSEHYINSIYFLFWKKNLFFTIYLATLTNYLAILDYIGVYLLKKRWGNQRLPNVFLFSSQHPYIWRKKCKNYMILFKNILFTFRYPATWCNDKIRNWISFDFDWCEVSKGG